MGNALAGRGASFFARLVMRFSLARLASDLDLFAAASLTTALNVSLSSFQTIPDWSYSTEYSYRSVRFRIEEFIYIYIDCDGE